ncbi:hypothetical protein ABZV29_04355 [Streptomyces sp. NPDC005236]|uniref:hypothetical protein n=1 Tax=Streptomyces sp. NPDC005236 TaxID=3157028 RepID=UPI0033A7F074
MSRDEATPEPTTEGDPATPGKPTALGGPDPAGETSGPIPPQEAPAHAPGYAVVISGDGSAAIDGEPVPSADGVTVDAAILDTLHGYARDRGTTVTATVSDPAAGYVAFVEVAPDGSSTLVDQREQPPAVPAASEQRNPPEPTTSPEGRPEEPTPADGAPEDAYDEAAADYDDDLRDAGDDDDDDYADADDIEDDDDDDDDFDVEAYTLEQQRRRESLTPPPPPTPDTGTGAVVAAGTYDDEDADFGADPDEDADAGFGARPSPDARFGAIARSGSPAARSAPTLVRRAGSRQSDDEYEGPGLLHRPLVVGPVALVAAALVIVPLVILGSGGSDDGGHRKEAARSSDETSRSPQAERSGPISTSTATLPPPPSPSDSPSAGPKKPKGTKGSKGSEGAKDPRSGGGVTVTVTARPPQATVTAKPAQDTAATAVSRLARNDPSGRHICYRAYVSGQGWQKPVCDGTMAGTSGRNSPIKALNIAVSGSGGSAANAFVHDPASSDGRGKWEPQWTAVIADGRNNYIGSTKKSAPVMSGFAINIGSGRICQTAKVHGFDWGAQGCADARPGYVFGGALENARWLEAVKFTV